MSGPPPPVPALTLGPRLRILAGPLMTSACDCFWS